MTGPPIRGPDLPLANPPRSLVLVRMSSIGDTVHALPLIASLHRAWPECRLSWVIQPGPYALMEGHPHVSRFFLFRRHRGIRAFTDLRRDTRDLDFDLVLDCHRYLKAGLVTWMLNAPVKVGFDRARAPDLNWLFTTHRIPARPPGHVQDQYFEFLEYLGVPIVREWDFFFSEEERAAKRAFFGRLDGPALGFVLRSSRAEKNWPPDRYARVLDAAASDFGLTPVLLGSAAAEERAAAEDVLRFTRSRPVIALGDDLRRLAYLLDGCAVVLSPDTGPLHIAVALDTPTIGLYGYTDPKRVGPYGKFGDLVLDRFSRPGEVRPSSEFRPGNMTRIEVDDVIQKLDLALRRYPPSRPERWER